MLAPPEPRALARASGSVIPGTRRHPPRWWVLNRVGNGIPTTDEDSAYALHMCLEHEQYPQVFACWQFFSQVPGVQTMPKRNLGE